jgi:predicted  nucleic acid-binding Zn-ribbon protein
VSAFMQQRAQKDIEYYKNELQSQKVFSQGVQNTLSNLTEENEYLKSEIEKEKEKLQEAEDRILTAEEEGSRAVSALDFLIQSQNLYDVRNYESAKAVLNLIDYDNLTIDAQTLYNKLAEKLSHYE